jgi:hypothetical protein
MRRDRRPLTRGASAAALALQIACGGTPTVPTAPPSSSAQASSAPARIDVTRASIGLLSIEAGGTLQLKATAVDGAGGQRDVTGTAVWQSSDPATAVVTSSGVVKGGQPGSAEIAATVEGVTGKVRVDIVGAAEIPRNCAAATLSSYETNVSPLENDVNFNVHTPYSDCRWTALDDASWLTVSGGSEPLFDPGRSGNGYLTLLAAANDTLSPRVARVTVTFTDGTTLVHTLTQAAPSCVFTLSPTERSAPYAATSGSFSVQANPPTCSWSVAPFHFDPAWNFSATGSGIGTGTVNYAVNPTPKNITSISFPIRIVGTNPLDPPAVFMVRLKNP